MKVRAKHMCFYQNCRRRPGDVFELVPHKGKKKGKDGKYVDHVFSVEEQFQPNHMEKVGEDGKPSKEKEAIESEPKHEKKKKSSFGEGVI